MKKIDEFTPEHSSYDWIVYDLGIISYGEALELQKQAWQKVQDGEPHRLYLLEHEPVITLGRRTDPEHLLRTEEELEKEGIELFRVNRGGSATYHGPGQLVGYVICKSSRMGGIHELVSQILNTIAKTLKSYDIEAEVDEENPGIWTKSEVPRKLAAVGMSNSKGYTMHGFAINVDLPLTGFAAIVPCGLTLPVTTIAIETGNRMKVSDVKTDVLDNLKEEFNNFNY